MKSKKNILFSTKTSQTLEEYKKKFKQFPEFYWSTMKTIAFRELLVVLIIAFVYKYTITYTIIAYIIILLITCITYKLRIESLAERIYKEHKDILTGEVTTDFYDDYLIKKGKQYEVKMNYHDIGKVIETDSNFYIQNTNQNIIVSVEKSKSTEELNDFIRKISNSYIKSIPKKARKNISNINNKELIKNILLASFLLTIFSIYGALLTAGLVSKNKPSSLFNESIWVFWLWLPIPIISIILGFKYEKNGFKCTKNIIGGFIVGVLLLVFGSFTFIMPSPKINYNKINNYKEILNVDFPKKGILTQENSESAFDDDKINVVVTQAFYEDTTDLKKFENEIINGEYWIKASDIKTELKVMIPWRLQSFSCKKCYYLIFNQTTNEYNKLPNKKGKSHIYIALYDTDDHSLTINDFDYNYK